MKKLITIFMAVMLIFSMTTIALAAPAGQNGYSVYTVTGGSGCSDSSGYSDGSNCTGSYNCYGSSAYSGSSNCSTITDYLKSMGIAGVTDDGSQICSQTQNSSCGASAGNTGGSSSGSTCGTSDSKSQTTAVSDAPAAASDPTGTSTASSDKANNTSDKTSDSSAVTETPSAPATNSAAERSNSAVTNSNSTSDNSSCTAGSSCVSGSCTADNSCTANSTCTDGSCSAGTSCTTDGTAVTVGTDTTVSADTGTSAKALPDFLSALLERIGSKCAQLGVYIRGCIGMTDTGTVTPAPSDTGSATPAPSDSGTETPTPSDSGSATPTPSDSGTTTPAATDSGSETPAATNSGSIDNLSFEEQVVALVNEQRAANGLAPLTLNEDLSNVARAKSQDMHDNNYFSHTSPTYGSPFDMMTTFGISYRAAGENIAMGYATPEAVMNAWMNSEGHRANILSSSFTEIGVGYVSDGNYWTQEFIG